MNIIRVRANNNIYVLQLVDDGYEFKLDELMKDYFYFIFKSLYPTYSEKDHIVSYWFKYGNIDINREDMITCNNDMEFKLCLQILQRDTVNNTILYSLT